MNEKVKYNIPHIGREESLCTKKHNDKKLLHVF